MEFDPYNRTELTGPWAGFAFLGNRLITPEGRELLPEDLAWLSLTACQAQEWRRMMDAARSAGSSKNVGNRNAGGGHHSTTVVNLRDVVSRRKQAMPRVMAGADAEPPMAADTKTGPKPRARG